MVLGIGPEDDPDYLRAFQEELGLTFPVLYDEGGRVYADYTVHTAFSDTEYPQDYLIDPSGTIAYVSNRYEPARLQELIDEMLSP